MLGAVEGTLEADKRELTRIINELKDTVSDAVDVALAADGWVTFRRVRRRKKAFTNERLWELYEKYPETFEYEKKETGGRSSACVRLVE